jgi:hypothetical protein
MFIIWNFSCSDRYWLTIQPEAWRGRRKERRREREREREREKSTDRGNPTAVRSYGISDGFT